METALRSGDRRLEESSRPASVMLIDAGPFRPGEHAVQAGIGKLHLQRRHVRRRAS